MELMELQPSSFAILSTLRHQRLHGWAILQQLRLQAGKRKPPAVATLYATLNRLGESGLVQPHHSEVVDGRLRIVYEITEAGLHTLTAHAEAMFADATRAMAPIAATLAVQ
jgi:PadR family transcriptional regulator, regulatory protein PadR